MTRRPLVLLQHWLQAYHSRRLTSVYRVLLNSDCVTADSLLFDHLLSALGIWWDVVDHLAEGLPFKASYE